MGVVELGYYGMIAFVTQLMFSTIAMMAVEYFIIRRIKGAKSTVDVSVQAVKRSSSPSNDMTPLLEATTTVRNKQRELLEHGDCDSTVRNARRNSTRSIRANQNVRYLHSRIPRSVVQIPSQVGHRNGLRNIHGFTVSRMGIARNSTPTFSDDQSTHHVQVTLANVSAQSPSQIPDIFKRWKRKAVSKVSVDVNDKSFPTGIDSDANQIISDTDSLEAQPPSETTEDSLRNEQHFCVSGGVSQTIPNIMQSPSTSAISDDRTRGIYKRTLDGCKRTLGGCKRALVRKMERFQLAIEPSNLLSRVRNDRNNTPSAIVQHLDTNQVLGTSSLLESQFLKEVMERCGLQNKHGFRVIGVICARNGTRNATPRSENITQDESRSAGVQSQVLEGNKRATGHEIPFSKVNPKSAHEKDLDTHEGLNTRSSSEEGQYLSEVKEGLRLDKRKDFYIPEETSKMGILQINKTIFAENPSIQPGSSRMIAIRDLSLKIEKDLNTHQDVTTSLRSEGRSLRETKEKYGSYNEEDLRAPAATSRIRKERPNTTPNIEKTSTQRGLSRMASVMDLSPSPISARNEWLKEPNNHLSGFWIERIDIQSALTEDLDTNQRENITSSNLKGHSLTEITGECGLQNENGTIDTKEMQVRNGKREATTQTPIMKSVGTSTNEDDLVLERIAEDYAQDIEHGNLISGVNDDKNIPLSASAQDLDSQQIPTTSFSVESRSLNAIMEGLGNGHDFPVSDVEYTRNEASRISNTMQTSARIVDSRRERYFRNLCESERVPKSCKQRFKEVVKGCKRVIERISRPSRIRSETNDIPVSNEQDPSVHPVSIPSSSQGRSPSETAEEYICTICLDMQPTREIRILPCLHKFHKKCIKLWLKKNKRCPICRCPA